MNLFSVIIPAYNIEAFIEEAIKSACEQQLKNIEIIVVDDCSTDGTLEIIERCALEDSRIKIIRNDINRGQSVARNRALDIASGEFIQFLDGDDMLAKEALASVYNEMKEKNLDIVHYDMQAIFEDEQLKAFWEPKLKCARLSKEYEPTTGVGYIAASYENDDWRELVSRGAFRRTFIEENNLRFADGRLHEDDDFTFRSELLATRVSSMRGDFYIRRFRRGSIMTAPDNFNRSRSRLDNVIDMGAAADRAIAKGTLTEKEKRVITEIVDKQAKAAMYLAGQLSSKEKKELNFSNTAAGAMFRAADGRYRKNEKMHREKEKALVDRLEKIEKSGSYKALKKVSRVWRKLTSFGYGGFLDKERSVSKYPYLDLRRFRRISRKWGVSEKTWFKRELYKKENAEKYISGLMKFKRSWGQVAPVSAAGKSVLWKAFHRIRFSLLKKSYPGLDAKDYFDYRFYDLKNRHEYRQSFITEGGLKKMEEYFNGLEPNEEKDILENKKLFNEFFSDLIHRDWIAPDRKNPDRESISLFCEKHDRVIAKPLKGIQGKGVFVQEIADEKSVDSLMNGIGKGNWIIEECVKQCDEMSALNSTSVNTVRVYTVKDGDDVIETCALMRMGNPGAVVDNYGSGGILANVDLTTGKVVGRGKIKAGEFVEKSGTGIPLDGFEIPDWEKIKNVCCDAHRRFSRLRYIGWDVAVNCNHEPILIEGNTFAAIDAQQVFDLIGKKPLYQSFLHNGEKL